MADIKVTSESLSGVANQLASGATSIESQLSNLKSLGQGLIAGDWGGAASQSFNELYEQCCGPPAEGIPQRHQRPAVEGGARLRRVREQHLEQLPRLTCP